MFELLILTPQLTDSSNEFQLNLQRILIYSILSFTSFQDFPLDDQNNILDSGAADESILTASEFQGCYGGGPGKVAVKQNEYILDTTQMLPNLTYVLYLHGYKDGRTGFAEKVLQLGSPKAPEVTVRYMDNYFSNQLS